MTLRASGVPVALDPLIGEAKRRMRQRRLLFLMALAAVGIACVVVAIRSPGGPGTGGSLANHGVRSNPSLSNIRVPIGPMEQHWRRWIRSEAPGAPAAGLANTRRTRRKVRSHVAASGAALVRLKVWWATEPPSVELVVATASPAAVFLKHHLDEVIRGINGHYMFVEVVDSHGSRIFEFALRPGMGTAYIRPGLAECAPFVGLMPNTPPCPAH